MKYFILFYLYVALCFFSSQKEIDDIEIKDVTDTEFEVSIKRHGNEYSSLTAVMVISTKDKIYEKNRNQSLRI